MTVSVPGKIICSAEAGNTTGKKVYTGGRAEKPLKAIVYMLVSSILLTLADETKNVDR